MVSNDPEIQQFINSIGERKVNQMMIDFFEEGKRQGYINPEHNEKLIRELSSLYLYGVMGKSDRDCEYQRMPERS